MQTQRTIAAIATPAGVGALAIVRMSGPGAVETLRACTGRVLEARRATLVRVKDEQGGVVDECVATWFAAPASFTGEDVVELSCHGGLLVTQLVLERLLACGASPAEPGEFSRRAFENGRLDLTQAEAVMDIIEAGSEAALRAAQHQLQGAICRPVEACVEAVLQAAAHVEAYIDFPEEDISPQTQQELAAQLADVQQKLERLLSTADRGRYLREGVRTAIIGAPNAGKSSLLNRLVGYERAIVSAMAGTTRDTVEEVVMLGGLCLRLTDTAGLRETADELERSGIERTMRAWQGADLTLVVADGSCAPADLPEAPHTVPQLYLLNKCDLPEHPAWSSRRDVLRISCATGEGFADLEKALAGLFPECAETATASLAAVNTRHRHALQEALEALHSAQTGLAEHGAPELVAVDLRAVLDALGRITGRVDTEDILTRVFSTFCLGK